ncbi:L-type lectin-domain containing receptor kinase S.1-like [Vicia villosa]|uniref:L-type lectin-domain containing receptor kinase S.1-like n=1 Tax=Vicia villosa TaxID=3911 RepID=UPI00273B4892|nr:L-type lectin-domain containing receptor kinase S.1-like [Vicia villosa]
MDTDTPPFHFLFFLILIHLLIPSTLALDFLFNSFNTTANLTFINDARVESPVIRITNDTSKFSFGRVFYPTKLPMKPSSNSSNITSFSTSFIFSILPDIPDNPGFGLAFVLCNTTSPSEALSSQYFGLFSGAKTATVFPLLVVEFDTGQNPEFNDADNNHIGIDLNSLISKDQTPAGYYNSTGSFVPVQMNSGENIRAWIDFDGMNLEINVTVAPAGVSRPSKPTLSYKDPEIANYISPEMFVGFSASETSWIEARRVLAWSFSDTGTARELNTANLPVFKRNSSGSLSGKAIAGIVVGCFVFVLSCTSVFILYYRRRKNKIKENEDDVEDWEMEYWPHRFSYEELSIATEGFQEVIGYGGFGNVYKGTLMNKTLVAVKRVKHDSKQGLKEFMAEISSMGRLQHKNLVQMRGWCRMGNELMLVYDYMPNGSLNKWIFNKPVQILGWDQRRRILVDVAEGINYLHHGWDQVVIHRDVKSGNILLDADMRGRLGDFGLAKLYQHGQVPNTTRVVGTLGYLAPEVATDATPTSASDVYSFGVVLLEVACGKRPLLESDVEMEEIVLVDWVRELYAEGCVVEAADSRIKGEYDVDDMEMVLKLGLACCHPDPSRRPTMKEVVAFLLGEDVAEARRKALSDLAQGDDKYGWGGGELIEEAPSHSSSPF